MRVTYFKQTNAILLTLVGGKLFSIFKYVCHNLTILLSHCKVHNISLLNIAQVLADIQTTCIMLFLLRTVTSGDVDL